MEWHLNEVNPRARVRVKLVAETGVEAITAGVARPMSILFLCLNTRGNGSFSVEFH